MADDGISDICKEKLRAIERRLASAVTLYEADEPLQFVTLYNEACTQIETQARTSEPALDEDCKKILRRFEQQIGARRYIAFTLGRPPPDPFEIADQTIDKARALLSRLRDTIADGDQA